jgi:hypothetical protein
MEKLLFALGFFAPFLLLLHTLISAIRPLIGG